MISMLKDIASPGGLASALGYTNWDEARAIIGAAKYTAISVYQRGRWRTAHKPSAALKRMQVLVKTLVEQEYVPSVAVHGYVQGRSAKTNAAQHVNRRWVMSSDLSHFFGSITGEMIIRALTNAPYRVCPEVARCIVKITLAVKEVVRTALGDNREFLPSGGVAPAVSRALDVLRRTEAITEDVINQAVWVGAGQPRDDEVKGALAKSVGRLVKRKKLAGVAFPPDAGQLGRAVTRLVRTEEGVTLQYNTGLEGDAVRRIDLENGSTQFVITTKKFTDHVLAEKSGEHR